MTIQNTPDVLVTGATGRVGGALLDLLAQSGTPARAIARRREQIDALRDRGVDAVHGDYDEPASVRTAMDGCRQLFLVSTGGADGFAQDRATIDAARDAGVEHVVKVSGSDANPRSSVAWAADYGRSDDHLRASGLRATILRPSCFMSNLLYMAPAIRRGPCYPEPAGTGRPPGPDPYDVAAAAHAVLVDPTRQGGAGADSADYLLTSTQPLSFPQAAEILGNTLGRRIRYAHIPGPIMYAAMRAAGSDHRNSRGMVMQFADVVRRGRDDVRVFSTDLHQLTGRPGTTLNAYIDAHRGVFA